MSNTRGSREHHQHCMHPRFPKHPRTCSLGPWAIAMCNTTQRHKTLCIVLKPRFKWDPRGP